MSYSINVSLKGAHYFATSQHSIETEAKLQQLLNHFAKLFPASQGFELLATRHESTGHRLRLESLIVCEFYKTAIEYLKENYGLLPADIDLTLMKAVELESNNQTPTEYIDRVAEKYDFVKKSDMTPEQALNILKSLK